MRIFILSLIISISFLSSSFASNYYEAGKNEFRKGHYSKANELLKYELDVNPANVNCRYIYAQSFVGLNNLPKAVKEYEKVIEQYPNSELAKLSAIAISKIHGYYTEKSSKSLIKTSSASHGDNYIQNAMNNGKIVRWNSKSPIKIFIESSDYASAVKTAINFWIAKAGTIKYTLVSEQKNADITVNFVNEVSKQTSKAYVTGNATPIMKGYMLQACEIKLRTTDINNKPLPQEELFKTALHEFGHALGIWGHSPQKSDIMYDCETGDAKNTSNVLSQRDINTLKLLYTLDPDVSNFAPGEKPVANSARNHSILGSNNERLNKKYQETVEYVKKYPKNAISWTNLGNVYSDSGQYTEAITCYKKSLEIDSNYAAARSGLALVYEKTGDFKNAVEQFTTLIKQEPKNIAYSHNLALYLIKNKKTNEASQVINNLIKANPDAVNDQNIKNLTDHLKNPG